MADHTYEIIVKTDAATPHEGASGANASAPVATPTTGTPEQPGEPVAKAPGIDKNVSRFVTANIITPAANLGIRLATTHFGVASGSQERAQRVEIAQNAAGLAFNAYHSAAGGMVFASSVGLSAGAGIGIGLMMALIQQGISLVQQQVQIDIAKGIEDDNHRLTQSRAGISYNRSRGGGAV